MNLNPFKKPLEGTIVKTASDSISHEAAFYFDVISEHSISIENNITDNYLENNTAVQDVIAHAPITITLSGLIGELVYVPSTNNKRFLNELYTYLNRDNYYSTTDQTIFRNYTTTDKLSALAQLYPPVDNLTQLAKNAVVYVEDSIERYKKIYENFIRNINDATRLQDVYKKLMLLRENNTEMIVLTPFGQFNNMYIQSINFTQANENHVADISITFKELKFASIELTEADQEVLSKYNQATQAQIENNGKADGYSLDSAGGAFIYNLTGKEPVKINQ